MRPNTPREQLLQNLLAMSSVLLYRATKLLGVESEQFNLVIEIEEWFVESQESIRQEIEQEYVVLPERRAVKRDTSPWVPPAVPPFREEDISAIVEIINKSTSYFGV